MSRSISSANQAPRGATRIAPPLPNDPLAQEDSGRQVQPWLSFAPSPRGLCSVEGPRSLGPAWRRSAGRTPLPVFVRIHIDPRTRWSNLDRGRALAEVFARRFDAEPNREPTGPRRCIFLSGRDEGQPWLNLSSAVFLGKGLFGNGGAMRVAPLGAWFADDIDRLMVEANRSAESDGCPRRRNGRRAGGGGPPPRSRGVIGVPPKAFYFIVLERLPAGDVREGGRNRAGHFSRCAAGRRGPAARQRVRGHCKRIRCRSRLLVCRTPSGRLRGGPPQRYRGGPRRRRHRLRHRGRHRPPSRPPPRDSAGVARSAGTAAARAPSSTR